MKYRDEDMIRDRLIVWKRLATAGVAVDQIAAGLRISRAALDQTVYRERRRGNPDAVYHAMAVLPGTGTPRSRREAVRKRMARLAQLRERAGNAAT